MQSLDVSDAVEFMRHGVVRRCASAVLSLSLIAITNVSGILAFCVLYGFFTELVQGGGNTRGEDEYGFHGGRSRIIGRC